MISNWLAFAVLVYGLGVGAHWWPGPITTLRHYRQRRQERRTPEASDTQDPWSDTSDIGEEDGTDMSVSGHPRGVPAPITEHAPGVFSSPDPRQRRIVRLPAGPRPLDDLRRERGLIPPTAAATERQPDGGGPAELTTAARRAWVRQQIRNGARSGDIVAKGAVRWQCSAKTIERDIAMQRAKDERAHRRH
jgi:hypothetical protein